MNQQENHEDAIQTESLPDLELATEQAKQTKGGRIQQGSDGNDWLVGGSGRDVLIGGAGVDR
jgi:Ca2+-binding RTX toxin-like protein